MTTMLHVPADSDVRDSAFSKWTLEFSKTIQLILGWSEVLDSHQSNKLDTYHTIQSLAFGAAFCFAQVSQRGTLTRTITRRI